MNDRLTHIVRGDETWTWRELRDYVVTEIEARTGTFRRSVEKEAGIFKGFVSRWGPLAPRIARYVFEVCDGTWNNEVITIHRFCKGQDPYFGRVIADRLVAHDQNR